MKALHGPTTRRYEIRNVGSADGTPTWTVIEYVKEGDLPETCLGGDVHWLREEYARLAKTIYESDPKQHGRIWHLDNFGVTS